MPSRRRFLRFGGAAGIVALAGCSDPMHDASTDTVTSSDRPRTASSTCKSPSPTTAARGTFRGAFNYTAPLYVPQGISRAFDAGEERTFAVTVDVHTWGSGAEPGDEVAVRVVAPSDDAEWSVTLA